MLRLGFIFSGCLVLFSCTGFVSEKENTVEQYYPVPAFAVGDTFVFDNPYVRWQVIAVKGRKVHWNSDSGDLQITDVNPLLPVLAWNSPVHGEGRRLISGQKGELFPIKVGNKASFQTTVSTDRPPYGWEFDWNCDVVARVAVRGPKNKKYDTFQVNCVRQKGDDLTFFYAPAVGHNILMENGSNSGNPAVRRMVAYQRSGREMVGRIMSAATREKAPPPEQKIASASPSLIFTPPSNARPALLPSLVAYANASNGPAGLDRLFPLAVPRPRFKPKTKGASRSRQKTQKITAVLPKREPIIETPISTSAMGQQDTRPMPADMRARTMMPARRGDALTLQNKPRRGWPIAVHLASYSSQASAELGWRQLVGRNPNLLGVLQPDFQKVNIQGRGTFFRVRAKPLPTRNAARKLCRSLKARGAYCSVVRH